MIPTGFRHSAPRCARCGGNVFLDQDGEATCIQCAEIGTVHDGLLYGWTHAATAEDQAQRHRELTIGPRLRALATDPDVRAVQAAAEAERAMRGVQLELLA